MRRTEWNEKFFAQTRPSPLQRAAVSLAIFANESGEIEVIDEQLTYAAGLVDMSVSELLGVLADVVCAGWLEPLATNKGKLRTKLSLP